MNKSSGESSSGETTTTASTCIYIDPLYCNRLLQISIGSAMFIASSSVMVLIMLVIIAQFKS
uniref:Uncharacterized protein n=2 Tax=Acrobeloides nanus TaxID=290746 RepID=A0A914CS11_9BILA